MPKPLALTDEQLTTVLAAAEPLAPADRGQFLRALADALRDAPGEIGDGLLARTIRHVVRPYFRPPKVGEPVHRPVTGPAIE
jgi:hypothetical protein